MPETAPVKHALRLLPDAGALQVTADTTLLEAVLAAGIAAPHSCTLGYCGSCRAALRSGIIEYPSGRLVDAGSESGVPDDIMLCIARARSDVEIEIRFAP